jgi:hypothetical protein
VRELAERGLLTASVRVPDAISDISIEADVRLRAVRLAVLVEAPREGRAQGKLGWMLRQLRDAPPNLRVDAGFVGTRETTSLLLADALDDSQRLLLPSDRRRDPRWFRLTMSRSMGLRRGRDGDSFVRETKQQVIDFYRDIVQSLRPWQARAPRLRDGPAADGEESTAFPAPASEPIDEVAIPTAADAADDGLALPDRAEQPGS